MSHLLLEDNKEQMMQEALLIIDSAYFIEAQIQKAVGELEEAKNNGYYDDAEKIEKQLRCLLNKVNFENRNMDKYMKKYEEKINEKKTILSSFKQEEQTHNGGLSSHQAWQGSGLSL